MWTLKLVPWTTLTQENCSRPFNHVARIIKVATEIPQDFSNLKGFLEQYIVLFEKTLQVREVQQYPTYYFN